MKESKKFRGFWEKLSAIPQDPGSHCPSDGQLARYAEEMPDGEERDEILAHIGNCPDCLATLSLSLRDTSLPKGFDIREAVERALSARQSLPLAALELGISRLGVKVASRRSVEPLLDRSRLRLRKILTDLSPMPLVFPLSGGRFRITLGPTDTLLDLEVGDNSVQGQMMLSRSTSVSDPRQVDLLEDRQLLFSDTLEAESRIRFPGMKVGHRYTVTFSSGEKGEFSLGLTHYQFGVSDIASLCVYHVAGGDVRAAISLCEHELPGLGRTGTTGRRIGELIREYIALVPETRLLFVDTGQRQRPATEIQYKKEMEAVIRRILTTDVVGPWTARLPDVRTEEEWEGIRAQVVEVFDKQHDSIPLRIAYHLIIAWLNPGRKSSAPLVALAALANTVESVLNETGAEENECGQQQPR
jgi:hypothetical protein